VFKNINIHVILGGNLESIKAIKNILKAINIIGKELNIKVNLSTTYAFNDSQSEKYPIIVVEGIMVSKGKAPSINEIVASIIEAIVMKDIQGSILKLSVAALVTQGCKRVTNNKGCIRNERKVHNYNINNDVNGGSCI